MSPLGAALFCCWSLPYGAALFGTLDVRFDSVSPQLGGGVQQPVGLNEQR